MIIVTIFVGIIIMFLIIQCLQWKDEGETYGFGMICGLALAAAFAIEIICICSIISEPSPKAMDVCQSKTTLEYAIRDGEVIDSIVVSKDNIYGKKD